MPIQPIWPVFEVNGLDWHCCLAGSSKTTPRISIFSIAIDADYSYEVKNSEIWVPAFFKHNNSFIATVLMKGVFLFFPLLTLASCASAGVFDLNGF